MNNELAASPLEQPKVTRSSTKIQFSDLYAEEGIAAAALAVVVASVTWGVVTRYVSHTPSAWTSELASIAFAWVVFLGSAAAFRRGGHIVIDALLPVLPLAASKAVGILANLVVLLVLIVMTVLSVRFTISTFDVPTTVLRVPQSVTYAGAAFGFAMMTLRHIQFVASGQPLDGGQS